MYNKLFQSLVTLGAVGLLLSVPLDAAAGKKRREASEENKEQAEARCEEVRKSGAQCKVVRANVLGCGGKKWEKVDKFGGAGQDYLACRRTAFEVDVEFVIADPDVEGAKSWVNKSIAEAERLYAADPALVISPTFVVATKRGGRDLNNLSFENDKEFHKFMDDNFDHVADSKTTGHLTVLVVGPKPSKDGSNYGLKVGGKEWGGKAAFPHNVTPFSRKHGPLIMSQHRLSHFSHELGHIQGLLHTFEAYTSGSRCNEDYAKGDKGQGDSRRPDGSLNVMDYGSSSTPAYINSCQEERAAKKRKNWMTNGGHINYQEIKGSR